MLPSNNGGLALQKTAIKPVIGHCLLKINRRDCNPISNIGVFRAMQDQRYRGRQADPTGLPQQLAKLHRHHNVPDTTISIHTELQCKRLVIFYG